MKKLMFAAAVVAAGVAMADVTSANVVGYQNIEMNAEDYTLAGPTFNTVGGTAQKFCLKDIKVQVTEDYEPSWSKSRSKWTGGCTAGDFVLSVLNQNGMMVENYYYQRIYTGTQEEPVVNEGWLKYDETIEDYVELTVEELERAFDAGSGFWILGNGMSLAPAGQVGEEEIEFECNAEDYTACGNGTPCELTLGDLTVTVTEDYEPSWSKSRSKWTGGCTAGDFVLSFLNQNGMMVENYYYQRIYTGTQEEPVVDEGWLKYDDTEGDYVKMTKAELDAVKIFAGKSFWILGNGMTLNIPAPEL